MKALYIFVGENNLPFVVPEGQSLEIRSTNGGAALVLGGITVFASAYGTKLEIRPIELSV